MLRRRRQQRCAHHRPRDVARGLHDFDPAGRRKNLDGLAARRGQTPQRRGRLVVVVGRAHRDEQQITVGGERRRRLALGAAGQPSSRPLALRVEFPDRGDVFGALLVELADRRHDSRAVRRHRQPGHPRQGEVVVEIAERGFGHATFVAQRAVEFDFQTHYWHTGVMTTVALAALPGRPCPIAAALELVGERWALLVVREIALGATRFSDIVAGTGAPRDRIAARLKALESAGVIAESPYHDGPRRYEYRLTESGEALMPVLDALLAWGQASRRLARRPRPTTPISTDERTEGRITMTAELAERPPARTGGRSARAPSPGTNRGRAPPRACDGRHRLPAGDGRRRAAAAADRGPDAVRDRLGRPGTRGLHLRTRRIGIQPDRRRPRRPGLHAAGLGDRLRDPQHAAAGQGLHLGRDQGELPEGGPAEQRRCSPRPEPS